MLLSTLGGILFFVLIVSVTRFFENKKNERELTARNFLYEIREQKNWVIKKITAKNALFHEEKLDNKNFDGTIFYDGIKKLLFVEVSSMNSSANNISEEEKDWLSFDTEGKFVKKQKPENIEQQSLIVLSPTYIEDKTSNFYAEKYIKGKTNWNAFNPLHGMGYPNSTGEKIYSDGFVFVNLIFEKDTIKYKSVANMGESGFNNKTTVYTFKSSENLNSIPFAVVEITSDYEENGIYLICHK